ncbi:MAG: tRNA threonylcarbamoyladenosine dehydratase, partial [Clostridia bacterium]|nr:tRNA threonylcarbamoyladenosine dehydratase [Clostridia bacterium]
MIDRFSRTRLLLGDEGVEKLQKAKVAVFGVGGVGGFAAEALARTGVGTLEIIDSDTVSLTNLNRQLIALESTIGQKKVEVLKRRLLDINPEINVVARDEFFLPETSESFDFSSYDYVVDAIDTVSGKIELVMKAKSVGTPIICSMGAGNKLDPTRFEVADLFSTSVCPLARVMRTELRKRGVKKLKVVYSKEPAQKPR